jgi:hypothetical protein
MIAPAPLWAMRPEAAALEVVAAALARVELAATELPGVVRVLVAGVVVAGAVVRVTLPAEAETEAEALPLAPVEVLARVNGIELGAVAVPVGVIPAR